MSEEWLLEALIIYPNEGTNDRRRLVNIAAAQAKRKEQTNRDIIIQALPYIPELNIFVAVYESPFKTRNTRLIRSSKKGEPKQ